jgi:hypothetical protein
MAERQPSRARPRKSATKAAPRGTGGQSAAAAQQSAADRIQALEAECVRLQFELDTARERIAGLEAMRKDVLDRIAWVIDSLHSLKKKS